MDTRKLKPLNWVGSSRDDMRVLPKEVRDVFGYALYLAQTGSKHPAAKPLKGFVGAGVLEIVEDHQSGTYRAVYTVRFKDAVYVLHVFQKKSKTGIETPQRDIDMVRTRLQTAIEDHKGKNKR